MRYILVIFILFVYSTFALANVQSQKMFQPLQLHAGIPAWQDYSKLRFYISSEKSGRILVAIAADGKRLYDVSLEISVRGHVIVPNQVILKELKQFHMAVIELEISADLADLTLVEITRFSAITK